MVIEYGLCLWFMAMFSFCYDLCLEFMVYFMAILYGYNHGLWLWFITICGSWLMVTV